MPYTRRQQEKKQIFEKNLFKCVTRQDLSGVPLITIDVIYFKSQMSTSKPLRRVELVKLNIYTCTCHDSWMSLTFKNNNNAHSKF